jgi:ribosome-binding protein aMBF1 (putative translation factor)
MKIGSDMAVLRVIWDLAMTIERVRAKRPLSSEERARNRAIQEFVKRERPGPDHLTAAGKYEETLPFEAYMDFRNLIQSLKTERERQGLTLAEVSADTGMDPAVLSRLETGRVANPTVDTLIRYATALGQRLQWGFGAWETSVRNGRMARKVDRVRHKSAGRNRRK